MTHGRPTLPQDIAAAAQFRPPAPDEAFPRVLAIPPFEVELAPTSTNWYAPTPAAGGLVLPAVAGTTIAGPAFQMRRAAVGILAFVTIVIDVPTAAAQVTWAVRLNGGPVPGLNDFTFFPRAAASYEKSFPVQVLIPDGALLTTIITNVNGGGPWRVGMEMGGWFDTWANVQAWTGKRFGQV
jgi:hypothetical protein